MRLWRDDIRYGESCNYGVIIFGRLLRLCGDDIRYDHCDYGVIIFGRAGITREFLSPGAMSGSEKFAGVRQQKIRILILKINFKYRKSIDFCYLL